MTERDVFVLIDIAMIRASVFQEIVHFQNELLALFFAVLLGYNTIDTTHMITSL
jgi:hypothetical protein